MYFQHADGTFTSSKPLPSRVWPNVGRCLWISITSAFSICFAGYISFGSKSSKYWWFLQLAKCQMTGGPIQAALDFEMPTEIVKLLFPDLFFPQYSPPRNENASLTYIQKKRWYFIEGKCHYILLNPILAGSTTFPLNLHGKSPVFLPSGIETLLFKSTIL